MKSRARPLRLAAPRIRCAARLGGRSLPVRCRTARQGERRSDGGQPISHRNEGSHGRRDGCSRPRRTAGRMCALLRSAANGIKREPGAPPRMAQRGNSRRATAGGTFRIRGRRLRRGAACLARRSRRSPARGEARSPIMIAGLRGACLRRSQPFRFRCDANAGDREPEEGSGRGWLAAFRHVQYWQESNPCRRVQIGPDAACTLRSLC